LPDLLTVFSLVCLYGAMKYDLSILIPARNEEFLSRTVDDLLEHKKGNTQIIIGLDGEWSKTPIVDHPDVVTLHYSESIGQRAMTKQLARLAKSKYIAKVDAHCAFDDGFDVKMLEAFKETGDNVVMVPVMRNLHIFDWVCPNGHRRYQGQSGVCTECGEETHKDIVWIPKTNPQSVSYCFDTEPHFQYFNEYKNRPEYKAQGDLTETMSLQGSFFMMTKDKYFELDIDDETLGSWGSQGLTVACKFWLSGGRCLVNHKTWYAHLFRTAGGDFGFPYKLEGGQVAHAKSTARDLFFNNKWAGQKKPLSWLVEKFMPVPGWTDADIKALKGEPTKGVLYYSDNSLNMKVAKEVRKQIVSSGLPITSVTLKPTDFGRNIVIKGERGYKTMVQQILTGLESMTEDIVYFCEHDVLYHPDHFKFTPTDENTFYYNGNYWFLRLEDGFAIHYDASPLSGLVVYRETAIKHFKERLQYIEKQGDKLEVLHMGFEPFTHKRVKWKFWCPFEVFMPENPNVDITHGGNLTWKRWNKKDFRKKPKFWEESTGYIVKGWNNLKNLI
jgi:glycosyltransferase involved in cell wall biosynthesis